MSYAVGLTGGIGSGKSTVAELFHDLGAEVIDTDVIARELTQAGGAAMAAIQAAFGREYLSGGALDRARMRTRVFSDPEAKAKLEAILHPLIRDAVKQRLRLSTGPYSLVVVPLFVETGAYRDLVDRVLVVDCEEMLQIERAMRRSRLSLEEVQAVMATQVSRAERLRQADDVIVNNGSIGELLPQVRALHDKYRELGHDARSPV